MTASADTRKGRTEAYERMRVSEDRVRALRGQSALMKQSLKSAKKSGSKAVGNESPYRRSDVRSPTKDQSSYMNTSVNGDHPGDHSASAIVQYSMLDSKQYT